MWRMDLLIEAAEAAVAERERELAAEHSVHGLDSLDETKFHPLLAGGFARAGFGVLREQPYPHEWRLKRGRRGRNAGDVPERRDRLRCDLVLTPETGQRLMDPLHVEAALRAHHREIEATLFAPLERSEAAIVSTAASRGIHPGEAFWLEVKTVGQHTYTHGLSGPNRAYAAELRGTAADLRKLMDDEQIHCAALLLLLFSADEPTSMHDLHAFFHLCLDRGLPIRAPESRRFPVRDLIGNALCTICLLPLSKLGAGP